MPAAISPITAGWQMNRNAAAIKRAAARITAIWRNSSFSSGIASLYLAMRFQSSPPLPFPVFESNVPKEKTGCEQDAIEGEKRGHVAEI
jgi:hypothetical protein